MPPKIVQPANPEEQVPVEIIATSIQKIADAMAEINKTRLTRKALVALIHDYSKVSKRTIELVLNNMDQLAKIWLKDLPANPVK